MPILINLLTFLEVIVCLLLALLVLMQRPRQEGLGAAFGSGVTDQMFGAQTTNVLQKATVYLGVALFGLTFLLAILVARNDKHTKGKATFVEATDKAAKPATGNDDAGKAAMEDALKKALEKQEADKKAAGEKPATPAPADKPATPAPDASAPTTPAAPAKTTPEPPAPAPSVPPAAPDTPKN